MHYKLCLLITQKFVLASPLWKQARSYCDDHTVCTYGLNSRSSTFFGNLTKGKKITALRNKITLKAPPGEWTYK